MADQIRQHITLGYFDPTLKYQGLKVAGPRQLGWDHIRQFNIRLKWIDQFGRAGPYVLTIS